MQREAVYGPYQHRNGWRVELHITKGGRREKSRRTFATEDEAVEFKRAVEREIARAQDAEALRNKAEALRKQADRFATEADRRDGRGLTVGEALERYLAFMRDEKGNRPISVETTLHRVSGLLPKRDVSLSSITENKAAALYKARRLQVATDTHRNELGQVKTFMNWCVEKGWIGRNPFAKVKGIGKRRRGKAQLRLAETRLFVDVALRQATRPPEELRRRRDRLHRESSLAVLVALYLGLRAGEVVNIRRRDVDDGGRLLWIPDSKTENGRRTLEVADTLRPMLWNRAQECDGATDRLFPHCRDWVLDNVKRLCRAAGVPEVTAHGVRGIHATIATQVGTTSQLVAMALGHGSATVTRRHYIDRGVADQARRDRLQKLIAAERDEEKPPNAGERHPEIFPPGDGADV